MLQTLSHSHVARPRTVSHRSLTDSKVLRQNCTLSTRAHKLKHATHARTGHDSTSSQPLSVPRRLQACPYSCVQRAAHTTTQISRPSTACCALVRLRSDLVSDLDLISYRIRSRSHMSLRTRATRRVPARPSSRLGRCMHGEVHARGCTSSSSAGHPDGAACTEARLRAAGPRCLPALGRLPSGGRCVHLVVVATFACRPWPCARSWPLASPAPSSSWRAARRA